MEMTNNDYVLKIPDMTFFQGDTITIPFEFYDGNGMPIDLNSLDIYWYLCPYGKPKSPVLILDNKTPNKEGEIKIIVNERIKNLCYVNLSIEDTKNMNYVKYTHQPVLVVNTKTGLKRFIRAEGTIIFKPMINPDNISTNELLKYFNR